MRRRTRAHILQASSSFSEPHRCPSYRLNRARSTQNHYSFRPLCTLCRYSAKNVHPLAEILRKDILAVLSYRFEVCVGPRARRSHLFEKYALCRPFFFAQSQIRRGLTFIHDIFFIRVKENCSCTFFRQVLHCLPPLQRPSHICCAFVPRPRTLHT